MKRPADAIAVASAGPLSNSAQLDPSALFHEIGGDDLVDVRGDIVG